MKMATSKFMLCAAACLLCIVAVTPNRAETTDRVERACGRFIESCRAFEVNDGMLRANCQTEIVGNWMTSEIELLLGNDDGRLVPGNDFMRSCKDLTYLQLASKFLIYANCQNDRGEYLLTSYDVNYNVRNSNGRLLWIFCGIDAVVTATNVTDGEIVTTNFTTGV